MLKCNLCDKEFNNLGGLNCHLKYCKETIHLKNDIIDMYLKDLMGIVEINKITGINKGKIVEYLGENRRSASDANILAHVKYPNSFKHSEDSKKLMREKHLKYMEEHPEKTAWRLSNLSYPEKLFLNKLKDLKWDEKYLIIREKSFFPFFVDFAFENEKIAVEIDGSQHLEKDRKERDDKKDKLLNDLGWGVIRITDFEIKNNIDNVFEILYDKLSDNKNVASNINVGILKENKKYIKKERNEKHFTESEIIGQLRQRKSERPSYSMLLEEIKLFGLEGTGRKYGVSGNSIKKWRKYYEKYENNIE